MAKSPVSELPDSNWYDAQSAKLRVKPRCTLANCETCPKFFLSHLMLEKQLGSQLTLGTEETERLTQKWATANVFAVCDNECGIWLDRDGSKIRGVSNFCPEVTAELFALFCSDLREGNDSPSGISVMQPMHYTSCPEFAQYATQSHNLSRKKDRKRQGVTDSVRWLVLAKHNFSCFYCGVKGDKDNPLQIDHVIPVAAGGTDDPGNLVAACKKCNAGKKDRIIEL